MDSRGRRPLKRSKSKTSEIDTDTDQSETGVTAPKKGQMGFFKNINFKKSKKQNKKEYAKTRRANETKEEREVRLKNLNEYQKKNIENETEEERNDRLQSYKEYEQEALIDNM